MTKDEKFQKQVIKFLRQIQATKEGRFGYKWKVQTELGPLDIDLGKPYPRQKIFTIYTRFHEPERAKIAVNCNHYSGKWNFHYETGSECLEQFQTRLEQILLKKDGN